MHNLIENQLDALSVQYKMKRIGVAFSGGPDSLALLRWTAQWARKKNVVCMGLMVHHHAATLCRKEVIKTLELFQELCPVQILYVSLPLGTQAKWREARYLLLCHACHTYGLETLLLGHHLDDVYETFLMRQHKQSQWRGLAGLNYIQKYLGIWCIRPLLLFSKQQLISSLETENFFKDEANQDQRYERAFVRKYLETVQEEQKQQFKKTINQYAKQRREEEERWIKELPLFYEEKEGYVFGYLDVLLKGSKDDLARRIAKGIAHISYQKQPLAFEALLQSVKKIFATRARKIKICDTLGGCLLMRDAEKLYFIREWGRLCKGQKAKFGFWDHRFYLPFAYHAKVITAQGIANQKHDLSHFAKASFPENHLLKLLSVQDMDIPFSYLEDAN